MHERRTSKTQRKTKQADRAVRAAKQRDRYKGEETTSFEKPILRLVPGEPGPDGRTLAPEGGRSRSRTRSDASKASRARKPGAKARR